MLVKISRLINQVAISIVLVVQFASTSLLAEEPLTFAQAQTPESQLALAEGLLRQGYEQFKARQYTAALISYDRVLTICQQIDHLDCIGKALDNKGTTYLSLGWYPQAVESYQKALVIFRRTGNHFREAIALNNLGKTYKDIGQYSQALEVVQQALILYRQGSDRVGEGFALNNIGGIYQSLGQYPQALDFFQQAVVVYQILGDQSAFANVTSNIGLVYAYLGNYPKALDLFHGALAVQEKVANLPAQAATLQYIGFVYRRLHQESEALKFYQKTLVLRRSLKDANGMAEVLNNIGESYERLGKYPQALQALKEALALAQALGGRDHQGNILDDLATVYKGLKQYSKAMQLYQQSLLIEREVGNRTSERITLGNMGDLLKLQNKPVLAIAFYKQSVNLTEKIRQEIRTLSIEDQKAYTNTIADTYRQLAGLLLQQDRVLEAQQVLDLLKVQELKDYLRNVRGNQQTDQGVEVLRPEAEILKKYNALQQSAIQLGQELSQIRKVPENQRSSQQQQRLAQLVKLETELNQQFNQFIDSQDVKKLVEQLSRTDRRQNIDLEGLNALREDLQKYNAALLYPLILDDRLELILTTPNAAPLRRTVKVTREELNGAIVEFRSKLNPTRNPKPIAQKLYQWLIQPLEADLKQAKVSTIIYAPDSQLRYIPLAALYNGNQWLVQQYRINNITARSLTNFTASAQSKRRLLAGAFVHGTYQFQVNEQPFTFEGLSFAGEEVAGLAKIMPNTTELLDKAFSRDATLPKLNDYSILHFATHAAFLSGQPEDSFILFGNGDRATLRDIEAWSLQNIDLVVLSACETGLGGKLGNGEEILGLGYQFQRAGAKAAIASLWTVSDGGTQVLMTAFYKALNQGMNKVQALQAAQQAMIAGDDSKVRSDRSPDQSLPANFRHPYYWAPFFLIGNGL